MSQQCARTIEIPDYGMALPDEIAAVERAWGESIPDHLIQIGGIDWKGWAFICRDTHDSLGIFRGEYRDAAISYQGMFRYKHPEGKSMPNRLFDTYFMSHMRREGIVFRELRLPRKDFFYMEIVNPELVRRVN